MKIAFRGDRKTGLDDVDAQGVERASQRHFAGDVQREARRLLAVAERRVEDDDAFGIVGHAFSCNGRGR